jgi:flagellar export protein FliJ
MKKFAFRLESVHRIRRLQEDHVRARLVAANREVQLAQARVEARQTRYDSLPRPVGVLDHDSLERAWFTLDAAAGAIRFADDELVAAQQIAEAIRLEWVEARRRTEVLERLRERAHDEWALETRRADDRAVDELVVARHHRTLHETTDRERAA